MVWIILEINGTRNEVVMDFLFSMFSRNDLFLILFSCKADQKESLFLSFPNVHVSYYHLSEKVQN